MTAPAPANGTSGSAAHRFTASFDDAASPITVPLTVHALGILGLRPGNRFLDVATGRGTLGFAAARLGAHVLATNTDPAMIDRLRTRARDEGLANITARVADTRSLDLPDQSFDAAGSQHGITLLHDFPDRLAELTRVTRPGGRILVVTVGSQAKAEFLGFFLSALHAVATGSAGPTGPDLWPFPMADPQALRGEFAHAGLHEVRVEPVLGGLRFRSGTHLEDVVTSTIPFGARLVAKLTPGRRRAVREVLDGMLRQRSMDGRSAVLEIELIIAVGTR